MTAKIIDGRAVAEKLRAEIRARVDAVVAAHGVRPGLSVIIVGDNPASKVYVRNKVKACEAVGIDSQVLKLP
jgi:methylenetetrahydrofolate dehydrogenase (NADP+) / methenyltetrahydrofolate cyclohydrolase